MQHTDDTPTASTATTGSETPLDDPEGSLAARTVEDGKRMEFTDVVEIRATKDDLWAFISDPETLTECVPGAERIDRVSPDRYTLDITRGVSHLTVSLSGEVEFVERNEPDWIVASGFAHDTKTGSDFDILAAMELSELDEETVELTYSAEVAFSGGVSSLGTGLLRPIVKRDVDTYFENIRNGIEPTD